MDSTKPPTAKELRSDQTWSSDTDASSEEHPGSSSNPDPGASSSGREKNRNAADQKRRRPAGATKSQSRQTFRSGWRSWCWKSSSTTTTTRHLDGITSDPKKGDDGGATRTSSSSSSSSWTRSHPTAEQGGRFGTGTRARGRSGWSRSANVHETKSESRRD